MTCYHPLTAYQSIHERTVSGKSVILFKDPASPKLFTEIKVPCSQCIGCRIARSKSWALRIMHEASLYPNENCFITLTYNPAHLPPYGSLEKRNFVLFMKRLRKHCKGVYAVDKLGGGVHYPIRFFHCGEYGSKLGRPHHHALIFNFDFLDRKLWKTTNTNHKIYRSKLLESLWVDSNGQSIGYSSIGELTFESAAYCARYITKKINGEKKELHYLAKDYVDKETGEVPPISPEYITMSRRPGLGKNWLDKNLGDAYPKDYLTWKGRKLKVPEYYDKIYDIDNRREMAKLKRERRANAIKHHANNSYERLTTREAIQASKMALLKRDFDYETSSV